MVSGQDPAVPQIPQQGTAEGGRGEVRPQRHPDGTYDASPKHGTLSRRECGLLVQEDPVGDPFTAKPQGSGDSPKDTAERERTDRR